MKFTVDTHAGQYRAEAADRPYRSNFSRLPWERIEHRTPGRPPVTLWVGASRVIAAVEMPGIGPEDVAVSVMGNMLAFREAGRTDIGIDIPLPCPVESNPVILTKCRGALCVLLTKRQEADPARAA